MHVCLEMFVRFLFLFMKEMVNNWTWVLLAIIILVVAKVVLSKLKLSSMVVAGLTGGLATAVNMFNDLGGGVITVVIGALVVGMLFTSMIAESKAHDTLKIFGMPFYFILGLFWLMIPIPVPGVEIVLALVLNAHEIVADVLCLIPIILFIVLLAVFFGLSSIFSAEGISSGCEMLNEAMSEGVWDTAWNALKSM
ncbi:MAG: hypothetical protein ABIF40_00080 [archaeon]